MKRSGKLAWDEGEFGLIDRIRRHLPDIDLTDDCAHLEPPGSGTLLITTDAALRGVHFPVDSKYMFDGGYRGLAGAVSDINASAGKPLTALLALVVPSNLLLDELDAFIEGLIQYSRKCGVSLVGGNITRGVQFGATFTVIGVAEKPIGRSGAKPGDLLIVTGALGGSEVGRMIVAGEVDAKSMDDYMITALIDRYLRPSPTLDIGEKLARLGATSMIDISDGLLADAQHIAEESGVCVHIELDKLPIQEGVAEIAKLVGQKMEFLAAKSGEEFEIIATLPPEQMGNLKTLRTAIMVIGEIREGSGLDLTLNGKPTETDGLGWRHF